MGELQDILNPVYAFLYRFKTNQIIPAVAPLRLEGAGQCGDLLSQPSRDALLGVAGSIPMGDGALLLTSDLQRMGNGLWI